MRKDNLGSGNSMVRSLDDGEVETEEEWWEWYSKELDRQDAIYHRMKEEGYVGTDIKRLAE